MKITDVKAIVVRQEQIEMIGDGSQDTVVIMVETDAGITGIGEVDSSPYIVSAIINAPASHMVCMGLKEILIGEDPMDIEVLWEKMYEKSYYYGRRSVGIHAMSGVEMALWDIKGQALGLPVYKLLGGAFKTVIPAYCSVLMPEDEDGIKKIVDEQMPQGFRGIKFGWGALGQSREKDIELIAACRRQLGKDAMLMIDIGMRWGDAKTAIQICNEIEQYNISWVEEPFWPDNIQGYKRLSEATNLKISAGEEVGTLYEFMELLENNCVDILQPDMSRCGGISIAKKAADIARTKEIPVIPHAFKTGILMSASLQFIASVKNSFVLEYCSQETVLSKNLIKSHYQIDKDGNVHIPDLPGLGIELNPEILEKYTVKSW
ncbi:MAG: mandelate racemase/muconate lactonizing enzyme family protein [Christensenellales bacterium]|jgi:L-rhamnonate dehydratase